MDPYTLGVNARLSSACSRHQAGKNGYCVLLVTSTDALYQAVNKFCRVADDCSKVPALKNKNYSDYIFQKKEWELLELICEVLQVRTALL